MAILQHKKFKILLLGDDCTDVYQFGTVDRISPEAPVPIFVPKESQIKPGMAGNVKLNLEALGCEVEYLHGKTSTKTRLMDIRSRQHIVRIDQDIRSNPIEFVTAIPNHYDAIVISDYDKGAISYELVENVIKEFSGPVFVDTKKTDLKRFKGAFIKINELEYSKLISQCPDIITTLGGQGARYRNITVPAVAVEVSDVCGAGDTFLASLAYRYCMTTNIEDSIKFAIRASGITVQHLGNYAPTLEEIG